MGQTNDVKPGNYSETGSERLQNWLAPRFAKFQTVLLPWYENINKTTTQAMDKQTVPLLHHCPGEGPGWNPVLVNDCCWLLFI